MCRIAGVISKDKRLDIQGKVQSMISALAHGGPDDEGIKNFGQACFAHRRLSIIDLSKMGHQPMANAAGSIWLTFNGEIYNFQELKKELESLGHSFRSQSDSEVIITAYEQWGRAAFAKFKGMFAFGLFDQVQNKCFLVRDQSGIKPLYYSLNEERLVFASEVRAFKKFDPQWRSCEKWKARFLAFGSIPSPFTTLASVFSLPKGSFLEMDLDSFTSKVEAYHRWTFSEKVVNEEEALALIKKKLEIAVERHLISDAPIGVFLSGGIDSSLLSLLAGSRLGAQLKTISINFEESSFDESVYQQMVLEKLHGEHTPYTVTGDMFEAHIHDFLSALDQPTNDGMNSYFVSKCAHERGLKAVLSGLGADEYFGGYTSFQRIDKLNKLRKLPTKAIGSLAGSFKDAYKRIAYLGMNSATGDYLFMRGFNAAGDIAALLDMDKGAVLDALAEVDQHLPAATQRDQNYVSFLESQVYMENQLLKDTDVMSMWHALEVRVPFLDVDLIEAIISLKMSLKFNRDRPKYMLTKPFEELLPDGVVHRQKYGFTFPFEIWLKRYIQVIEPMLAQNEVIDRAKRRFLEGRLHWSKFWSLAMLDRF